MRGPDLSDRDAFETALAARFQSDDALIDSWQNYSWDKRSSPGAYLEGLEVGWFEQGRHDVVMHVDRASACADFLFPRGMLGHPSRTERHLVECVQCRACPRDAHGGSSANEA